MIPWSHRFKCSVYTSVPFLMTSLGLQFIGPRIHSHLDVDTPLLVQFSLRLICSVQCSVDTGIHSEFICPTLITRIFIVFRHFLFYSVLYYYLSLPYILPTVTTQLDLECLRSISAISLSLPTLPGISSMWYWDSIKVTVDWERPDAMEACWGRILCSQHVLWVSPSLHRAAHDVHCGTVCPQHMKRCDMENTQGSDTLEEWCPKQG